MAVSVGLRPLEALFRVATAVQSSAGKPSRPATSFRKTSYYGASSAALEPYRNRRSGTFRLWAVTGQDEEDGSRVSILSEAGVKSPVDMLMEGISFGQLCDEFECISSPAVERTARQLVKDIMDIREGQRSLSNFGVDVKYKDPIRSFKGRNKYKRANWIDTALEEPAVVRPSLEHDFIDAVLEMKMLSTSVLNIKWIIQGKPKLPFASAWGCELVLAVNSIFTMNQISGQVILHKDEWDMSASHLPLQAYFWITRFAFSTREVGKDVVEKFAQGLTKQLDKGDSNVIYPDPSGDPRKFFQTEESPQKDLYQAGLVIALLYLLVQFLRLIL